MTTPIRIAAGLCTCWITILGPTLSHAEELVERDGFQWRRGNMHTHSHWSDGDDYLESIAKWYKDHDYDFLVFTDHNVLANSERWVTVTQTKGGRRAYEKLLSNFPDWVKTRGEGDELAVRLRNFSEVAAKFDTPGEFLLVQGEEVSDSCEGKPIHMNASNLLELIEPQGGRTVFETIQNNVRALQKQREATGQPMIIHLNHPNFGFAVTAEDLMGVRGEKFFEIYNGHSGVNNSGDEHHADTERIWDIVLAHRLREFLLPVMYGIAVDDCHEYHDAPRPAVGSEPGRGWVMVLTRELTVEALIRSLEAGQFYSSSGVSLRRIASDDEVLTVEVDSQPNVEYRIEFIGTRRSADLHGEPIVDQDGNSIKATKRYGPGVGEVLKAVDGAAATYRFAGDELYVRARITSSQPHPNPSEPADVEMAWTQPVVVSADQ